MFRQDKKLVAIELGYNFKNLTIAQMLKDLPENGNIGVGEVVLSDVRSSKIYIQVAEFCLIPHYQIGNYVASDVVTAIGTQLSSNIEISTSKVDERRRYRKRFQKLANGFDVWQNDLRVVAAAPRIKIALRICTPFAFFVDGREYFFGRLAFELSIPSLGKMRTNSPTPRFRENSSNCRLYGADK